MSSTMETHELFPERIMQMQEELREWRDIAYRLTMPYHDDNCEYGVKCSYCVAMEKASKR